MFQDPASVNPTKIPKGLLKFVVIFKFSKGFFWKVLLPNGLLNVRRSTLPSAGWLWLCQEDQMWSKDLDLLRNTRIRGSWDHPQQRPQLQCGLLVSGHPGVWAPHWQVSACGHLCLWSAAELCWITAPYNHSSSNYHFNLLSLVCSNYCLLT